MKVDSNLIGLIKRFNDIKKGNVKSKKGNNFFTQGITWGIT